MKIAGLHIIFLLFLSFQIVAQEVVLKRQVIGSFGETSQTTDIILSATSGEAIVEKTDNTELVITQGFQQASNSEVALITYSISVKDETCPDTEDGEIHIIDLAGCDNGTYAIDWAQGETGTSLVQLNAGAYPFVLTACGRIIADTAFVENIYETSCNLKFYSAFSPNGDEVNDLWEIDNIDSEPNSINEIVIFNRWGDEIQSYANYNNSSVVWDGQNENGKDATEGTYYYTVKIQDRNFSGYIELTR